MKRTHSIFLWLICCSTLCARTQQEIQAQLQWIDTKGEVTALDWRWVTQWVWQKKKAGSSAFIPKLHLFIEYPAHFPLQSAADPSVRLKVPKSPFPEKAGFHTLLIEETEALFTKTLPYVGLEGKTEMGGLAVTLTFDEPAVLLHESCTKAGLQVSPSEGFANFFYLGFFCQPQRNSLDVTLTHSQDVQRTGAEKSAARTLLLEKKGESRQLQLAAKQTEEEVQYELAWMGEAPDLAQSYAPDSSRLQASLSSLYLNFRGSDSQDHFSELSLLARMSAEFPTKRGSAWTITAELAVTPLSVLHTTRTTAPASLLFADIRLKRPLGKGGASPRFFFEAGPAFLLSDLPTKNRDSVWGIGPQIVFTLEGRLLNSGKRPDRFWAELTFLNFGSFAPSLENPRLGLGMTFPFSALHRQWQLSFTASNTQYGESALSHKGHLNSVGAELQSSL